MNINYGLLPPMEETGPKRRPDGSRLSGVERGRARKRAMSVRALEALDGWLSPAEASAAA